MNPKLLNHVQIQQQTDPSHQTREHERTVTFKGKRTNNLIAAVLASLQASSA